MSDPAAPPSNAAASEDAVGPPDYSYVGGELSLFKDAHNWKRYFAGKLRPYIRGDVLEVGAGIGGTTRLLCDGSERSWTCLEPDGKLVAILEAEKAASPLPLEPKVVVGDLGSLPEEGSFDTILYIDVLEHIEDDHGELERAAARLSEGGHLIVLSPAYSFLFSKFDEAVGHFRRYTGKTLAAAYPKALSKERLFYLDSVGMLTSLVNRLFLKQGEPTPDQIRLWDRVLVQTSKFVDPLVFRSFGRSVIGIYRRG